jgi:DedD protein
VDTIVKQRLVGALILLALGVVFWPIIFVREPSQVAAVSVAVPPEPPVDLSVLPEPDNLGLRRGGVAQVQELSDADVTMAQLSEEGEMDSLPSSDSVIPIPDPSAASTTLGQPALDDDGLPIAFTLQVATMAKKERAEALRDQLVEKGYKGYLKRLRRDDKVLYRVLVGPRYTREELEPIKLAIDESWRVESLIMRYLP